MLSSTMSKSIDVMKFNKKVSVALFRHMSNGKNEPVYIEKIGSVSTIILNRPKFKNSIDSATASLLAAKVREFEQDSTAKVGVLWGVDGFCSGADLKAIGAGNYNRLEDNGDAPLGPSRIEVSKPIIAAISGPAVAGGLELALWCDMRVMEEDAYFGVFCRRFGVPLIDGGTVRLPRLIGLSRAMDLILTGRPVHAEEALNFGLANRIVPKGQSRQAAEELARQIASFPQDCMLVDRRSAYAQHDLSVQAALRQEFSGAKHIAKDQLAEGVGRFNSKEYKKA